MGFLLLAAVILPAIMLQPRDQEARLMDFTSIKTLEQAVYTEYVCRKETASENFV